MTDEYASFTTARTRLEEIAEQATAKDTPLEKAIELLEEGARIAHRCTELLDHTEWRSAVEEGDMMAPSDADVGDGGIAGAADDAQDSAGDGAVESEE